MRRGPSAIVCPSAVIPKSQFAMLVPYLTVDPFVDNAPDH
jgi:hypothetical protein